MRKASLVLVACAALLAACSSAADSTESATASADDTRGGIPPGYPIDADVMAPLVITTIGPEPIPVTGTDGKVHVAYEISVLNLSPRPATITALDTLAGGPDGEVVASLTKDEVLARTFPLANFEAAPVTDIPVGGTVVLVLDGIYDTRADVPAEVTHRLVTTYGPFITQDSGLNARYPDTVTQIGGAVTTGTGSPVKIGPPLAGDGWVAANGCCVITSHRGAMMAVGGRISGTERYAVDWMRIDVNKPELSSSDGDGSKNEDYFAYDAPLLAVADGTVVSVVSNKKDEPPHHVNPNLTFDQLGGNYAIIDIGNGNYAFYAHMIPGSASVKVGDTVSRGDVIGNLGNSGNTSEVHLHFHISRAPTPLSSDNVPYEIDGFTFVGSTATDALVKGPDAGERTDQLPLNSDVVNFPK
ncbi:M23 family metallopeptidase [Rhodococcus sp. KBS0724]|jgi:murein DD-endopeptidase MepM/ murein hydrolase activator NlpD|uniref:M23 family metallopeptidase n=1 Tax=Rhodococcus sp. KBS0724 TaxID=1179674 RepID=UPI00110F4DF2|nr:M23 family metallopeptidase [Rhodococcus sp. KBS0724]TSD49973.1 M23 family metallopeptidase [Rhodococcus sp. KBS0724]